MLLEMPLSPAPTVACEGNCLRGVLGTPYLDATADECEMEWGDLIILMLGVYFDMLGVPSCPVAPFLPE